MITVVHGMFRCSLPFDRQTVEAVRRAAKEHFIIADKSLVFVNGKVARAAHVLKEGDSVEFAISDDEFYS